MFPRLYHHSYKAAASAPQHQSCCLRVPHSYKAVTSTPQHHSLVAITSARIMPGPKGVPESCMGRFRVQPSAEQRRSATVSQPSASTSTSSLPRKDSAITDIPLNAMIQCLHPPHSSSSSLASLSSVPSLVEQVQYGLKIANEATGLLASQHPKYMSRQHICKVYPRWTKERHAVGCLSVSGAFMDLDFRWHSFHENGDDCMKRYVATAMDLIKRAKWSMGQQLEDGAIIFYLLYASTYISLRSH